MSSPPDAVDVFADVARSLAGQDSLPATLQRIVDLAVTSVPGTEHAAVSMIQARRRVATVAATHDVCRRVDEVQYETRQGPCLDAIFESDTVHIEDLRATDRWPLFATRAADLGIASMLSFRLFVEDDTAGAINLYARVPSAFSQDALHMGEVFAAHAALAHDHAREAEGLQRAAETRSVIGQAQGILMATRKVTPDEAFRLLRRSSQATNVKLRDVADEVVRTGELAG